MQGRSGGLRSCYLERVGKIVVAAGVESNLRGGTNWESMVVTQVRNDSLN